jgi:hypothetical protein
MKQAALVGVHVSVFAADWFVSLMPEAEIDEDWTVEGKAPADAWCRRSGMIPCAGQPNGVKNGWPASIEVQSHFGKAGSLFDVRGGKIGGAKRGLFVQDRPRFGSWDRYEITSRAGKNSVVLTGVLVNQGSDTCHQSEGWPVFCRNIEIEELN